MNRIISYIEMCRREEISSLQRGMNFRIKHSYSIILMSIRKGAPYKDQIIDEGRRLIYEGHNVPRITGAQIDPKLEDQSLFTPTGKLTQNGLFYQAVERYKKKLSDPEKIRVYEKIQSGIWIDNGLFELLDAWCEYDGKRNVWKFELRLIDDEGSFNPKDSCDLSMSRIIPPHIKIAVYRRDQGRCRVCGAKDQIHFDHILPFSKGGTSLIAENIQLLCARHNLSKSNKIL